MTHISSTRRALTIPVRVALVGMGPTGLAVLERLVALAPTSAETFEISVWEPNTPGAGVHAPEQPDTFQLNTIASQINVYPGSSTRWENGIEGPSFADWLRSRPETAHYEAGDYAPRRYCGAYLAEAFDAVVRRAPENVIIAVHRERVQSVTTALRGGRYLLKGEQGTQAWADRLCLCVGHLGTASPGSCDIHARVIENPYPLPGSLAGVHPGEAVAVQGMGLAASDVVRALTVGRGGRFEWRDGVHAYVPSGREPAIWLYSGSGMPFRARPFAPPSRHRHPPLILTRQKIDALRRSGALDGRLNFMQQILPLLKQEMSVAYLCADAELARAGGGEELRSHIGGLASLGDPDEARVAAELARMLRADRHSDPDEAFSAGPPAGVNHQLYATWFRDFLQRDLEAARFGLLRSPLKAGLEVCRDVRDVIRYAVDFGGLTEDSHREFYRVVAPNFNRLVGGPTMESNQELITLLDAGIVRLPPGPIARFDVLSSRQKFRLVPKDPECGTAIFVDCIVKAHVVSSGIIGARGPVADLHRSGYLTAVVPVAGLDGVKVDHLSRPINMEGDPVETLAVIGPVTEGARFYNHYIASADGPSRLLDDADLIARRMLGLMKASRTGLCRAGRAVS